MKTRHPGPTPSHTHGYVLLEAMLAVAIFAIAVLSLGRALSKGLNVERLSNEDTRVWQILENRAAEVEGGEIPATASRVQFKDINGGLTLIQSVKPVHKKDEKGQDLANLFLVNLEADWTSDAAPQSKSLSFYVIIQNH